MLMQAHIQIGITGNAATQFILAVAHRNSVSWTVSTGASSLTVRLWCPGHVIIKGKGTRTQLTTTTTTTHLCAAVVHMASIMTSQASEKKARIRDSMHCCQGHWPSI